MDSIAAREEVLTRTLDLSPTEFELLCKVVLQETLPAATLTVTPRSHDGGIDLEGRLEADWVAADFGVQAKRYAPDNAVGSDRVHRLGGALLENNYHVGTLVTTSSFTRPAREATESLPIRLVDGEMLAATMVSSSLGVLSLDDRLEVDETFWQGFGEDTTISTGDVPLANNFDRVKTVLEAMIHTDGTPSGLHDWLNQNTSLKMGERHVRINANGAVILGLARTEPAPADQDRYGPTDWGAEWLRSNGGRAERLLVERIREAEIIRQILIKLESAAPLTVDDINGIVAESTDLSNASVDRRGSAVRTWLARLPEVEPRRGPDGDEYRYVQSGLGR